VEEPRYGPTEAGTVLLELGAEVGALILHVPQELNGHEIDISRAGAPGAPGAPDAPRTHAQVRERPSGRGTVYSALYPGLVAGTYAVWRDEATVAATVTVTGGQVASCNWPAADPVQEPGPPGPGLRTGCRGPGTRSGGPGRAAGGPARGCGPGRTEMQVVRTGLRAGRAVSSGPVSAPRRNSR
jgi:hypothetical protein